MTDPTKSFSPPHSGSAARISEPSPESPTEATGQSAKPQTSLENEQTGVEHIPDLRVIQHGFVRIDSIDVDYIGAKAHLYKHLKTGAELMHVVTQRPDNHFSISFDTIPKSSRGEPHMAEHWIFTGSENFKHPDPVLGYDGSVAHERNAYTLADHTAFMAGTRDLKDDFLNLFTLYLDGVFKPLLWKSRLHQEAWRIERDPDPEVKELSPNGIVRNEMHGWFSDLYKFHESVLGGHLFPGSFYQFESGGHPAEIPFVRTTEVRRFVQDNYHPSNAKIVLCGQDIPDEAFALLNKYLDEFEPKDFDPVKLEYEHFTEPRTAQVPFPGSARERKTRDACVTINWALGFKSEWEDPTAIKLLSSALLDYSHSPLKVALQREKLGENVFDWGIHETLREWVFTVGANRTSTTTAKRVQETIIDTLRDVVENGFPPGVLQRAANVLELDYVRAQYEPEFNADLAKDISMSWHHGESPFAPLTERERFASTAKRALEDDTFLREIIQKYLIDNPQRLTLVLYPERGMVDKWLDIEKARIEELVAAHGDKVIHNVDLEYSKKLRQVEGLTSLSPENLLRSGHNAPEATTQTLHKGRIAITPLATPDIVHFRIGFDLNIPHELLPFAQLVPLIFETNANDDFPGDIESSFICRTRPDNGETVVRMVVEGDALSRFSADLFERVRETLAHGKFKDPHQVESFVLEHRAIVDDELEDSPFEFAEARAAAQLRASEYAGDMLTGVGAVRFLDEFVKKHSDNWAEAGELIERIRDQILANAVPLSFATGDEDGVSRLVPKMRALAKLFPDSAPIQHTFPTRDRGHEGYSLETAVSYICQVVDLKNIGYSYTGATDVIEQLIARNFFWPNVRQERGAYHPRITYQRGTGLLYLSAGLVEDIAGTLHYFEELPKWLADVDFTKVEREQAQIAALADLHSYNSPFKDAGELWVDSFSGFSSDNRAIQREQILAMTHADLRIMAEAVAAALKVEHPLVILGNKNQLRKANRSLGENRLVIESLE